MDANAKQLLAHLPYLRRYARALTGNGDAGDALVARAVEEALADPAANGLGAAGLEEGNRGPLYSLLNRLFDDSGRAFQVEAAGHPMEAALALLPERERRLYLLVNLEALPTGDAGAILGISREEARNIMARAQESVREALIASIMIVEDDAIIAFDLAETVRGMGHKVCGTAATMDAALTTAQNCQPTLALMDLRLAHGDSGITTAQMLRRTSELPIIFVTAFADEMHQRGLEHLGPIIRKPFTREEIERAITQAVFAPSGEARVPALAALAQRKSDRKGVGDRT